MQGGISIVVVVEERPEVGGEGGGIRKPLALEPDKAQRQLG